MASILLRAEGNSCCGRIRDRSRLPARSSRSADPSNEIGAYQSIESTIEAIRHGYRGLLAVGRWSRRMLFSKSDSTSRAADEFLPCTAGKYSSAPRLWGGGGALFRHAKLYGFFRVCCSNWVRPPTFSRENTRGIQDFDNRLGIFSQRSWNHRCRRHRLWRVARMESVPRPEWLWDFQ